MPHYDFSTLNDKDLEQLARDLLNKKFSLTLHSYKKGRDGGIDLRDSSLANNNQIIVQVKHYYNSGYKMLMKTLEKEVIKVRKLNPHRYIIVTSLPLSAANQDEIKKLFEPFIQTPSDVIGNETLNAWLGESKEIERTHFKLWLSSVEVINSIVNNAVTGRSGYYREQIQERIRYYVTTQAYSEAYDSLVKNKILIITGEPGAGKTTLADMLSFQLLGEGYSLFKIESIKEAEENLSLSPDQKQLFYFDDFLGSIHLDLMMINHPADSALDYFFKRIRKSTNKLFLLTSRTVILNRGLESFERFRYAYLDREKTELSVAGYSDLVRGKILYNHMYFQGLPRDFVSIIKKNDFFLEIIRHDNFSPRLIEFVTDPARIENLTAKDYKQFLLKALENPTDIWRFSFEKQLNDEQRFLLMSLFSVPTGLHIEESLLQEIYERRLQYEIKDHNHHPTFNSFQSAIKILIHSFISRRISIRGDHKKQIVEVAFINPSVQDFLRFFLASSDYERIRMIASFIYYEQVKRFLDLFLSTGITPKEIEMLQELLLSDSLSTYKFKYTSNDKRFESFWLISRIAPASKAAKQALEKINFNKFNPTHHYPIGETLSNNIHNADLKKIIQLNFDKLIIAALGGLDSYKDISIISRLFVQYERDLKTFFSNKENIDKFRSRFHSLMESEISFIKSRFFYQEKMMGAYEELSKFIRNQTTSIESELHGYFKLDFEIPDEYEWYRENEDEFVGIVTAYDDYDPSEEEIAEQEEEEELRELFE